MEGFELLGEVFLTRESGDAEYKRDGTIRTGELRTPLVRKLALAEAAMLRVQVCRTLSIVVERGRKLQRTHWRVMPAYDISTRQQVMLKIVSLAS